MAPGSSLNVNRDKVLGSVWGGWVHHAGEEMLECGAEGWVGVQREWTHGTHGEPEGPLRPGGSTDLERLAPGSHGHANPSQLYR